MGMTAEEKILFEQRCRTCLLQQGQHNIFESSNCIRIELLYLTNLEIQKYDKLPVSICDHCLNDLKNACAFKKKCQESYFTLIEEYESYNFKSDDSIIDNIKVDPELEIPKHEVLKTPPSPHIKSDDDYGSYPSDDENDLSSLLEPQIIVQEQPLSPDLITTELYKHENILNETSEKRNEEIIVTPDICNVKKHKSLRPPGKRYKGIYECSVCGKNFVRASNLKAHMPLHTGIKKFSCPDCDKSYATLDHLKRHRKSHENKVSQQKKKTQLSKNKPKDKEYKCLECGEIFECVEHLKDHVLVSHKVQLEFQCTMCEKSFALESHLKIHFQLHSGEKSYKCDVCGLIFRSTPSLESHKLNHVVTLPGYQFADKT